MSRVAGSDVQGVCRVAGKPCTRSGHGAEGVCRVCRVCRVVPRARVRVFLQVLHTRLLKKLPAREVIPLHTLHTLHIHWESKAKHVQGCF